MERRRAMIAAAGISLTLLAGGAAIGINTQLVGASGDDKVGQIRPVSATSGPGGDTVEVDGPTRATVAPSAPSDDDRLEGRDDGGQHEGVEHEYEGADDDD